MGTEPTDEEILAQQEAHLDDEGDRKGDPSVEELAGLEEGK